MQPLTSGRRVSTPVWEWMFPTFLPLYLCQKWWKTRVGQCFMSQSFSSVYVDKWPTDATTLSETQHEVPIHQMHFISCFFFLQWLDRAAHMLILLTRIQEVPSSILGWDPNYTIPKHLVTFFGPPWWDIATNLAKPLPSTPLTIHYLLTILPFDAYSLSY